MRDCRSPNRAASQRRGRRLKASPPWKPIPQGRGSEIPPASFGDRGVKDGCEGGVGGGDMRGSRQHSARETARPPSEQSWAEVRMPSRMAWRQSF